MTGGTLYLLDETGFIPARLNSSYVREAELSGEDISVVNALIQQHRDYTASPLAVRILEEWEGKGKFLKKIIPLHGE
jgi:glutamate synthase domain-containing protein 3